MQAEEAAQKEISELIEAAITIDLSDPWNKRSLDQLYLYSKYIDIEKVLTDEDYRKFIKKISLKTLVEFDRNNERILEDDLGDNKHKTLFDILESNTKFSYIDPLNNNVFCGVYANIFLKDSISYS